MGRLIYTDPSGQELSVPFGPNAPVVTVGRAMDCTIRSNRKSVSRHHAEFRYHNGRYEVIDNGSSNGTYLIVNEERRQLYAPQQLSHQDEVWCGDFILRFYDEVQDADSTYERGAVDFSSGPNMPEVDMFGTNRATHDFGASPPPRQGYDAGYHDQGYDQGYDQAYDQGLNSPSYASVAEPGGSFGSTPPPAQGGAPGYTSQPFHAGGFDEFQEIEPDVIEVDPDLDEELDRLRAEKNSIEELASRQAYELDELRNRLREKEAELERAKDELDERPVNTMVAPADLDRVKGDLDAARGESERLRSELEASRRRIEELERLQDEQDERESMTVAAPGNLENLASEMELFKGENQRLSEERDEARVKVAALERTLEEAYRKIDELRAAQPTGPDPQVEKLSEELRQKQSDIAMLESELEHLQGEVGRLQSALESAGDHKADQEKIGSLNRELERQGRLLEEFERRSRDLKDELDQEIATTSTLKKSLEEQEAKLDELETLDEERQKALEQARGELAQAEAERDEARAAIAAAQAERGGFDAQIRDLKNEVEGLKMRLKLEKERSKSDEGLAEENDALRERVTELEARLAELGSELETLNEENRAVGDELALARQSVELSQAISPAFFSDLQVRVETLERIMDAIERTDLQPLSTVDRIRLQSAIRDTKPKKTLEELRTMVQDQLVSADAE